MRECLHAKNICDDDIYSSNRLGGGSNPGQHCGSATNARIEFPANSGDNPTDPGEIFFDIYFQGPDHYGNGLHAARNSETRF
jgi:hypothetical protein